MFTQLTQQVFYSWDQFGLIVENLAERIESLNTHVTGLVCKDQKSFILAYALCEKLQVPLFSASIPGALEVSFDNLSGTPDVVITNFTHEEEQFNTFKEPKVYYATSKIDSNGNKQNIIFPWKK